MQILVEGEPIEINVSAGKNINTKILAWKMSQKLALISTQFITKIEHQTYDDYILKCYFCKGGKK